MDKSKKELKSELRNLENEGRELQDIAMTSHDINEVRSINQKLTENRAKIAEVKEKIDNFDDTISDDVRLVNGNISSMFGRTASFRMANSFGTVPETESSRLILRSNESLVSRLPENERQQLDLGKCIRGMVYGDWNNAEAEKRAINTTQTGALIPSVLSAQVIDKARNISLFTSAGVPIVPMESNNLTIARVKTDPVFAFKEELAAADESGFELEPVELKAKTAYGYAYVSKEAILSAPNLTDTIYRVFSQAFADMCDRAMLYGQLDDGSIVDYAPSGVFNDTDINSVVATNIRYNDFIKAASMIKKANGIPTVAGINATTEEILALLVDSNGNVLQQPEIYANLVKIVSNQLTYDAESGSDALVFDPNAMLIGVQNRVVIRMIQDSDYCLKNNAVGFQICAMLDCAVTQPKHITKITGIKELVSNSDDND